MSRRTTERRSDWVPREDMRALRRRLDLTQRDLAQRVGCTVETIKRLEAGDPKVSRPVELACRYVFLGLFLWGAA